MVNYQKYLRSTAWKKKRFAVMKRCRGMCERCSKWPVTNVHHLSYANVGDEPLGDLLGVCAQCHLELHERRG